MSIFEKARSTSKVNAAELKKMVYGSIENAERIKKLAEFLEKNYSKEDAQKYQELDRVSQIKTAYRLLAEIIKTGVLHQKKNSYSFDLYYICNLEIPGGVSAIMVQPLIETLCSEKQQKKWASLFNKSFCFGAYAQTELGHGSDVQSLETEAVFDEKTKEIVIHSPTVSSYKWWPGELSNLSNIAIVFAKTIVKGKKLGVFPFIVQIRDFETHQPIPGVEIGDIGPKFGYNAKENGFLKFTHFRIPLENMPNRFVEITPNGDFIQKGNIKIMYTSMMKTRTVLLNASANYLGKGVAIALRYSFLRKQFRNDRKEEVPVIQYQLQQFKLFPFLAKSFAMQCSFRKILDLIQVCNQEIANNNFQNLQEIHVILSGSKAFYTWWCNNGLFTCMQCCGGHGYSHYSGIPSIITVTAPNTILEGENTILTLQVGRFLLKCYKNIIEGKPEKVNGYCRYLKNMDELNSFNAQFNENVSEINVLKKIFQKSVLAKLTETVEYMTEFMPNLSITEIFNKKIGIHMFEIAKLHTILFTIDYFMQYIADVQCNETKAAMLKLAHLFIVDQTLETTSLHVSGGSINSAQIRTLQAQLEKLLEELFKDALMLSEAFVVSDYTLFSALADSNEKPYENLYNLAKNAGIVNRTDLTGAYLETIRKASLETFGKPKL